MIWHPLSGGRAVTIAGRELRPTAVFDTYWRFAAARQQVYEARLAGEAPPWTADPILAAHRFTNCYRAADRVSQFLITQVCYRGRPVLGRGVFPHLAVQDLQPGVDLAAADRELGEVTWDGIRLRRL